MKKQLFALLCAGAALCAVDTKAIVDAQFGYDDSQYARETFQNIIKATGSNNSLDKTLEAFYKAYNSEEIQKKFKDVLQKRFSNEELEEIAQLVNDPLYQKYHGDLKRFVQEAMPVLNQALVTAFSQGQQEPQEISATKVIEATDATIDELLSSHANVIVDVYSPHCGPCKQLAPIFAELSLDSKNCTFVKIDSSQNPQFATKYKVRGVPTLLFFKQGKKVDRTVGFTGKEELADLITSNFN